MPYLPTWSYCTLEKTVGKICIPGACTRVTCALADACLTGGKGCVLVTEPRLDLDQTLSIHSLLPLGRVQSVSPASSPSRLPCCRATSLYVSCCLLVCSFFLWLIPSHPSGEDCFLEEMALPDLLVSPPTPYMHVRLRASVPPEHCASSHPAAILCANALPLSSCKACLLSS